MRRRLALAALIAVSFVLTLVLPSGTAGAFGYYHSVTMSGLEEAPTLGDADGDGVFAWQIAHERLCYVLTSHDIDTPTAAHIHRGGPGVPGPIVVGLRVPVDSFASGCIKAQLSQTPENADMVLTCEELAAISANPDEYYANVHNGPFPNGAVRGQLTGGSGAAPSPTPSPNGSPYDDMSAEGPY
jgi:hypothetical protein